MRLGADGPEGEAKEPLTKPTAPSAGSSRPQRWRGAAFLGALLLVSFNLRTAITSVPPVLTEIQHALGLDGAAAGALTALPVVCLAVMAPLSSRVRHRWGGDRAVGWALAIEVLGFALRLDSSAVLALYASTLLAGVGLAVMNTMLPSIVSERYAGRSGLVIGLYVMVMGLGATVAAGVSAPLAQALGGWERSLSVWAIPAVLAVVAWVALASGPKVSAPRPQEGRHRLPWKSSTAWLLSIYMGFQAVVYYSLVSWLAPSYQARGWSAARAGLLFSLFSLVQLAAAPLMPALAARHSDHRPFLWFSAGLSLAGLVTLVAAPGFAPWEATCVLGFGVGGLFPLGVTLLVWHAPDPGASARLSAMAFFVSYLMAAIGPVVVGALRDMTGGFEAGWTVVAACDAAVIVSVSWLTPRRRAVAHTVGLEPVAET